ncbi:hypothetical protein K491DRAFT_715761 [Lophiostoma macrostomum CBS 122681]|uniref:Secreted protein n=1 Tax=Lophiostoma macrostomum CBS 122681 TaxID=1314788 RepID=A0A6A6T7W2_9PLEO|nr:hypothetical protein K491DRAFT_715761 [Lophiostoma macrostomum CBS 122681]
MPSFRKLFVVAALAVISLAVPLVNADTVVRTDLSDSGVNIERNPLSDWGTNLPETRDEQPEPEIGKDL